MWFQSICLVGAALALNCDAVAQLKPARFSVPPQFDVGSADFGCLQGCPFPAVTADLNHDGYDDLITLDFSTGTIFVTLGGAKGFQKPVSYPAGPSPISLAIGDFNRDGNLDVVVVGTGVNLLLGTGSGAFQPPTAVTVPEQMAYVTAGDFNGDGKLDLAFAADFSYNVYVTLGNGDGTFRAAVATATTGPPIELDAGSFHNNGLDDLILITEYHYFVSASLLASKGDGTFQAGPGIFVPAGPVVVADMNEDGILDLVTVSGMFSGAEGEVQVWLGNGQGDFTIVASMPAEQYPISLAIADVNGDGIPDVVSANSCGSVSVLLGKGDGSLQTSHSYKANDSPQWAGVGTYFGSDRADVAVINPLGNRGSPGVASLLRNDGQGHLPGPQNIDFPFNRSPFVLADMNQDGSLDIVAANPGSASVPSSVTILPGNGKGAFGKPLNVPVGVAPSNPVVGDFDGDGTPDFAVLAAGGITVGLQQAPNIYQTVTTPFASATSLVWGGDLNGDGLADLIVRADGLSVLLSTGGGSFGSPLPIDSSIGETSAVIADFNNDGIPDIAMTGGSSITVVFGNGDGTFGNPIYLKANVAATIAAGDFDHNGNQDLALPKGDCCGLLIFLGDGKGGFQPLPPQTLDSTPIQLFVGDFNNDGNPDLLMQMTGYVQIYLGNGTGKFTLQPVNYYPMDTGILYMQVGDINNDGKPDFVGSATGFSMFINTTK